MPKLEARMKKKRKKMVMHVNLYFLLRCYEARVCIATLDKKGRKSRFHIHHEMKLIKSNNI